MEKLFKVVLEVDLGSPDKSRFYTIGTPLLTKTSMSMLIATFGVLFGQFIGSLNKQFLEDEPKGPRNKLIKQITNRMCVIIAEQIKAFFK